MDDKHKYELWLKWPDTQTQSHNWEGWTSSDDLESLQELASSIKSNLGVEVKVYEVTRTEQPI